MRVYQVQKSFIGSADFGERVSAAAGAPPSSDLPRNIPLLGRDGIGLPVYGTLPTWCRLSGMGRTATYIALSEGRLKAIKLGSRTLIDVHDGLAWLRTLPPAVVNIAGHKNVENF